MKLFKNLLRLVSGGSKTPPATISTLLSAIADAQVETVIHVLERNPSVINERGAGGKSALQVLLNPTNFIHIASTKGGVQPLIAILELLLSHGADPNGDSSWRPVIDAARISSKGIDASLKILLETGADPNAIGPLDGWTTQRNKSTNPDGTALNHYLYNQSSRLNAVELLIQFGADPTIRGSDGWSAEAHARNNERLQLILKKFH